MTVSRLCGIICTIKIGFNKSLLMFPGRSIVFRQVHHSNVLFNFIFPFLTFLSAKSEKIKKINIFYYYLLLLYNLAKIQKNVKQYFLVIENNVLKIYFIYLIFN